MTKLNEYTFRELINTKMGHIIISYDTLDDFRMKVDMLETESYKEVHNRLIINVIGGMTVKVDNKPQEHSVFDNNRSTSKYATTPSNGPDPKEIESISRKYRTVEEYLESMSFAVSDKAPYPVAYFRTLKQGKVKEGYLNVYCNDDGLWNMNKWVKKDGKQYDFDDSWPIEYRVIMEVVDAIDRRIKVEGE